MINDTLGWVKNNKKKIVSEIIISIIAVVFCDSVKKVFALLSEAGNSILVAIIDLPYAEAAKQGPASLPVLIFSALVGLMTGAMLLTAATAVAVKLKEAKSKKIEKKITESGTLEALRHKKAPEQKTGIKKIDILWITFYGVFLLVYGFYVIALPAAYWNAFEISIDRIAPYVSDEEIKELKSEWTLMKTKDDFDKINGRITEVVEQNGLKK